MEICIAGHKFSAAIRWAKDLLPVLAFPKELKENFPAYFMFRDVYYSKADRLKILENNLRFDLTFIPPNKVGLEFIKTYGHYHPLAESGLSYPEIYEVLEGKAFYLLQRIEDGKVVDVIVIKAGKGSKVVIPPNYGHVTINPSNKELKMANWVYRNFSSIYGPYKEMQGACYYYTKEGWIKNKKYKYVPEIRFVRPKIPKKIGLKKREEMYKLIKTPEKLEFLWKPSRNADIFEI